jgi:hypothetical protein
MENPALIGVSLSDVIVSVVILPVLRVEWSC